jgi:N-methylhydantoinase B
MSRARASAVELAVTRDRLTSVAEEMAVVCMRTAVSPNIKERRDLSAAVFNGDGVLVAHAAHIPVHLGAMPVSVRSVLGALTLGPGDVALINDPYAGGTHLPDITAVMPVFEAGHSKATFVVAVRAHHADVGGRAAGSMSPEEDVFAEGLRIPPVCWQRGGVVDAGVATLLFANMRDEEERRADLAAQVGALHRGAERLQEVGRDVGGLARLGQAAHALVAYADRLAGGALAARADGEARARLALGVIDRSGAPAEIAVRLQKRGRRLVADFAGTSGPVGHGLNATAAVVRSAVYYFVRCLCPPHTPANDGLLARVRVQIPPGSLLDAVSPHPVAGGNVETSQRLVDVLWLAAARLWPGTMPAPGSGTMSNWTFGPRPGSPWMPAYYETLPGGGGGGPAGPGAHAIQQHMTNTAATPTEVLERRWPVRVLRMALRRGSGGGGVHPGGEGLCREIAFLAPARAAFLMTRHESPPPGIEGGLPGAVGRVRIHRGSRWVVHPPLGQVDLEAGDRVRIETPGGGGWGAP